MSVEGSVYLLRIRVQGSEIRVWCLGCGCRGPGEADLAVRDEKYRGERCKAAAHPVGPRLSEFDLWFMVHGLGCQV